MNGQLAFFLADKIRTDSERRRFRQIIAFFLDDDVYLRRELIQRNFYCVNFLNSDVKGVKGLLVLQWKWASVVRIHFERIARRVWSDEKKVLLKPIVNGQKFLTLLMNAVR